MKAREFNPRRLDVRPFAEAGEPIEDTEALASFDRLVALRHTPASVETVVQWSAQGELRARRGAAPEVWLHLQGSTALPLQCQRCLETVEVPLAFDRWFLFVDNERQAAELDAESEEDVLVISRHFDLLELVEDELLLVAPIVPRHEVCPVPVTLSIGDWSDESEATDSTAAEPAEAGDASSGGKPNPFAALAALRKPASGG